MIIWKRNILFLAIFLSISISGHSCEKDRPKEESGQHNAEIINEGNSIILTANDCFFFPVGNLQAVEKQRTGGTDYNKGWILSHITGWSKIGDTIIWAIKNCSPGKLIITPKMAVLPNQEDSQIGVHINSETKSILLKSTGTIDNFEMQNSVSFDIKTEGAITVKLTIKNLKTEENIGDLLECKLSGSAINNAEKWNRRWRPLAVHCKWKSSLNPENIVLAIHENIIQTTDIHMYQPTTTPFGYTGSTWEPKTRTFGGYNFSLWSYGAKEPEPPLEQFSHLIAVGPDFTFGEYGHEGTGVKPRGPNPYEGHKTNRQVVAVRKEPGIPYDTYYSYYLHPETNKWVLYGCGRKYNSKKEISYLSTGAFIEEPGPPTKTRNGHIMREVHFSGWLMDENNSWYPVDIMSHGGDDSSISYKNWGVKNDKFFMQMGGIQKNVVEPADVLLPNPPSSKNRPDYLKEEMLNDLYRLPAQIEAMPTESINSNSASVKFNLIDGGTSPKATIFWGEFDALTFDYKWENKKEITVADGENSPSLNSLISGKKYFYRVQVINKEGTTWMMDTQSFTTK